MPADVLSVSKKTRWPFLQQKNAHLNPSRVGINELKNLFGLYYLTVLVYTKTTIHLSVGE